MKKLEHITDEQIRAMGVQSLATRPNAASTYGTGGLSAKELQLCFDRLASFLASKINEILEILNNGSLGEYVPFNDPHHEIESLTVLLNALSTGDVARLLHAYESVKDDEVYPLQTILYSLSAKISKLEEGGVTVEQTTKTYTIPLLVSAWQEAEGRFSITTPIEGLKEHDVVLPRVSHDELWDAFDLKVEMTDGSITASVNAIPAEDAVMDIAVLKTLGGEE